VNGLLERRLWLSPDETVKFIDERARIKVSTSDLYRLALDGQLALSVHIPSPLRVWSHVTSAEGQRSDQWTKIDGVWELPLECAARIEIEARYADGLGLSPVDVEELEGAVVRRDDVICELEPDGGGSRMSPRRRSALPYSTQVVITMPEVLRLIAVLATDATPPTATDKPLMTREREILLTIIASLAKSAGFTLEHISKDAQAIEALTVELGNRVAERTIEEHLKRARDLIRIDKRKEH
jgi:hypothetical protein